MLKETHSAKSPPPAWLHAGPYRGTSFIRNRRSENARSPFLNFACVSARSPLIIKKRRPPKRSVSYGDCFLFEVPL